MLYVTNTNARKQMESIKNCPYVIVWGFFCKKGRGEGLCKAPLPLKFSGQPVKIFSDSFHNMVS